MEKCIATITVNAEEPKPPTFEDLGFEQVVHCKDCKNGGLDSSGVNGYWCSAHTEWHDGKWFCADGERRDNDA